MIFLREIKSEPLFISSENVEDYEMHKSGFGTVVTDLNGSQRHVKESMEEIKDKLNNSCDRYVNLSELDREPITISFNKPVSPKTLSVEVPKNVPSRVNPIVIFPTVEAEIVTVKVTEYDSSGSKMVNTTVNPELSHVINLNTGVE